MERPQTDDRWPQLVLRWLSLDLYALLFKIPALFSRLRASLAKSGKMDGAEG